jgi:hypothetical protein
MASAFLACAPSARQLEVGDRTAQVGGKLAQIGSRLVDAAAAKIAEDFFRAFEAQLRAETGTLPTADEEAAATLARLARARRNTRWIWWAVAIVFGAIIVYRTTR